MTTKRQFKLVKDYPTNKLQIGTIVKQDDISQYVSIDGNVWIFDEEEIHNYPEFWKEVFKVADGFVTKDDILYTIISNTDTVKIYEITNYFGQVYNNSNLYSKKENAEAKLKELAGKNLKYYTDKTEKRLGRVLTDNQLTTFQGYFKKQYWLLVLEEIAKDLNQDWIADWSTPNQTKYCIKKQYDNYSTDVWTTWQYGVTVFKSKQIAQKAIEIMSDKLDYIFK
jgi:hypothetical protein